jgi:hypothetical protein
MSINPSGFETDGYSKKMGILSGASIIAATSWKESGVIIRVQHPERSTTLHALTTLRCHQAVRA